LAVKELLQEKQLGMQLAEKQYAMHSMQSFGNNILSSVAAAGNAGLVMAHMVPCRKSVGTIPDTIALFPGFCCKLHMPAS